MPTIEIYLGRLYSVEVWVDDDSSEVLSCLEGLKRADHKDADKLWALIHRVGDLGPPRDQTKCRPLKGNSKCDGIFEFKASGGSRIAWFYGKERTIVMTHCFRHGDSVKAQCDKTNTIREQYKQERD